MADLRVAVDARPLAEPPNGIRRWLESMLGSVCEVAQDIQFTLLVPRKEIALPDGVNAETVVVQGSISSVLRPGWELGRLPGALRRLGSDVFLSSYGVVPLNCPMPTVSVVHDLTFLRSPHLMPWRYRLYWRWMAWTVRRADQVIVPSKATELQVVERLNIQRSRINVVPHAAGEFFAPAAPNGVNRIRERYGLPKRFVLAVGTLEPRKNLSMLIEAMGRVNEDRPDAIGLVLAGRQGWGGEVAGRAWLHHVKDADDKDLAELYGAAAVFAMPSLDEGFGLPALEAMACGAPVVVSDAGALPEVVDDAGITVAPSDVGHWVRALSLVLDDQHLADDMRRKSVFRAKTFSWQRSADTTAEILRRVAEQSTVD